MKIILLLYLVVFSFFSASAQSERFLRPADEAKKDASFFAFRTKLIAAAKRRDAKFVLGIVDKNIKNSFGGNDGIAEFRKTWNIESSTSKFWDEFLPVITNGGRFSKEGAGSLFSAPYSFADFPDDLDAFTYGVIFGNNVNLRAAPQISAKTIARLSYNIVEIKKRVNDTTETEADDWYEIATLGGKKGFVKAEFVRSPVDYRAGFEKQGGKWKMTFFIAGD